MPHRTRSHPQRNGEGEGVVSEELQALIEKRAQLKKDRLVITAKIQRTHSAITDEIAKGLGKNPHTLEIGRHACPPEHIPNCPDPWLDEHWPLGGEKRAKVREDNPNGRCVYEPEQDPCRDRCLFCGEPEERK